MKRLAKIVLIGGGGHCKVVIDALLKSRGYKILGVIDEDPALKEVLGIKVIGKDRDLSAIFNSGCKNAFVCVGSVGDVTKRLVLSKKLQDIGFHSVVIKHPSAIIGEGASIGEGTLIAAGAIIGPHVKIGKNAIINTGSRIDHDCNIADFVHIAPGVTLSGSVKIGRNSHVGTGASVIEKRNIGSFSIIGAGSVVVSDIPSDCKAFGIPCRVVSRNGRKR